MKVFLVLASIGMLASAAPQGYPSQSGGGYNAGGASNPLAGLDIAALLNAVTRQAQAAAPSSSYGAPSGTSGGAGSGLGGGYAGVAGGQGGQGGLGGPGGLGGQGGPGGPGGFGGNSDCGANPSAPGCGGNSDCGANPSAPGCGGAGGPGSDAPLEQQVHKHVYVHVAPSEAPEPKAPKAPSTPQVPEKHYKILFIRAPEPPPYEQPDIADIPPAPEQKTIVYVLLKKPDATPAVTLPAQAPTKPSKPEVYFIRYKSPEANNDGADQNYGAPNAGGTPLGPSGSGSDSGSGSAGSSSGPSSNSGSSASQQYGAPSRSGY